MKMKIGEEMKIVSVLIPVRNEEQYITNVLMSLEKQSYPKDKMEIIIIDGSSEDKTIEKVEEYKNKSDLKIKIILNEKKIIPISLNLGIKEAQGEYIVRLDGHSIYNYEYIENGIKEMENKEELVSIGGYLKINPSSDDFKSFVTAKVFSSPFGTGISKLKINFFTKFRDRYNDTALYGIYRTDQLREINGYNEKLEATQDIELYDRLKKKFNGKIFLSTKMRIEYFFKPKTGLEIYKRQLRISQWLMKRNTGIRIRHLAPLLVAILGVLMIIFNFRLFLGMVSLYFLLATIFYILEIEKKRQLAYLPYSWYVFFMNHLGYFFGTTLSIINKIKNGGKNV